MSEHTYHRCPVCRGRAWLERADANRVQAHHCVRCGDFRADHYFRIQCPQAGLTATQIANISGYIRENPGALLTAEVLPYLRGLPTPTISDKAIKLLRHLRIENPRPGREIGILSAYGIRGQLQIMEEQSGDVFPPDPASEDAAQRGLWFLGAASAEDEKEVRYLIELLVARGFLTMVRGNTSVMITGAGWDFLQSRPDATGDTCFVAMSFADALAPIWLGPISEGIRNAGYHPFRVDNREHNDDITDEILAGIRTSRFVLADFTGQRNGVYYEAGFAAGLGKPVVRTVREDETNDLHFDTRQLNHIRWRADAQPAFARAITARIVATIGQGPVAVPSTSSPA